MSTIWEKLKSAITQNAQSTRSTTTAKSTNTVKSTATSTPTINSAYDYQIRQAKQTGSSNTTSSQFANSSKVTGGAGASLGSSQAQVKSSSSATSGAYKNFQLQLLKQGYTLPQSSVGMSSKDIETVRNAVAIQGSGPSRRTDAGGSGSGEIPNIDELVLRVKEKLAAGNGGTSKNGSGNGKGSNDGANTATGPVIPSELRDVAEVVNRISNGISLEGWADMTTQQQRNALKHSGLSDQEQWLLLNASSNYVETIAKVQDIYANSKDYDLTYTEANDICKELMKIAQAREDTQSEAGQFRFNARGKYLFLRQLDEREEKLLASIQEASDGIEYDKAGAIEDDDTAVAGESDKKPNSIPLPPNSRKNTPAIAEGGDIFDISDVFKNDAAAIESLIISAKNGDFAFVSEKQKQSYLNLLSKQLSDNETFFREQLSDFISESGIKIKDKSIFQQLSQELSASQLGSLVDHIQQDGLLKTMRTKNWEKLMREVLSDKTAAKQLIADESYSPIGPHIWEGNGVANQNNIEISGYYYQDGQYYSDIGYRKNKPITIPLGKTLPSDVAIRITRATNWDKVGEQIGLFAKEVISPPFIADTIYATATKLGVPELLPPNIMPSDTPNFGKFLESIDPLNHSTTITDNTVFIMISIEHGGDGHGSYEKDTKFERIELGVD